jgi:hypothetical protein
MFIIYDNTACLLAALTVGPLLFSAGAICIMLMQAGQYRVAVVAGTNPRRQLADGKMDG